MVVMTQLYRVCYFSLRSLCLIFGLLMFSAVTFAQSPTSQIPKATQRRSISQREYAKAVQSFYLGGIESAIAIHLKNVEKDPLFFDSYLELIALYKESSQLTDAVHIAQLLYERSSTNTHLELYFTTLVQAHQLEQARGIEALLPSKPLHVDTLFYRAFLAYRLQEYANAVALFNGVLEQDAFFAAAAFFMGLSYQENNQPTQAIEAFTRTLKIEPNFTTALYPMALSQLELGQKQAALTNLRRARNLMPRSERLNRKIAEVEASLPKAPAPAPNNNNSTQRRRQDNVTVPTIRNFAPVIDNPTSIRIGLVEDIRELQVKTGGAYVLKSSNGDILYTSSAAAGEVLTIRANANGVAVINISNTVVAQSKNPILLSYQEAHLATAVFDVINGAGYYFSSVVTRYYRGELEFMPKPNARLTLINQLNFEEYLFSVVPSEMPASWPEDALRAQAVAARTYALATMGTYKTRGFDLLSSVASQAYTGMAGEHARTTQAVIDTSGMVLYSKITKNLLVTYYSANHGGYSEDGHMVWKHAIKGEHLAVADIKERSPRKEPLALHTLTAWLKTRPATHSSWPRMHSSFAFRGAVWIDNEDLSARIARANAIGSVKQILTRSRGISGRASVIDAVGTTGNTRIEGDIIRSSMGGLRSNLFSLETIYGAADDMPQYFVFRTAGWGHGVGLDQSGAAGMAADGHDWKKILLHYYPSSQLKAYVNPS
jgi:stage II sporulation protein D